jgi:hypothetical protein
MKKADNFDASKWLVENKITTQSRLNENQVNNKYVVKDEELSDEEGDFYTINRKKAFEYLKQFDNKEVSARQFIKDDEEGLGQFEGYIEGIEQMSDKELEDAMREEMSMYFFSKPDEIQPRLNEDRAVEKMYEVTVADKITKDSSHVWVSATSKEEAIKNLPTQLGLRMEAYDILSVVELPY